MLLAGIAINAIALAGVGLFSYLSSDLQLRSVAFWALGSFNGADWGSVQVALVIPLAVLLLYQDSQKLNAVTLGDLEATHLGINVPKLRTRIVLYTAVITGASGSAGGYHRVYRPGCAALDTLNAGFQSPYSHTGISIAGRVVAANGG